MSDMNVSTTPGEPGYTDTAADNSPFLCETCGQNKATHVLASLEERDTSLFCGSCLVVTFAKVAHEIGKTLS